jgi:hypothetical protein
VTLTGVLPWKRVKSAEEEGREGEGKGAEGREEGREEGRKGRKEERKEGRNEKFQVLSLNQFLLVELALTRMYFSEELLVFY